MISPMTAPGTAVIAIATIAKPWCPWNLIKDKLYIVEAMVPEGIGEATGAKDVGVRLCGYNHDVIIECLFGTCSGWNFDRKLFRYPFFPVA